MAVNITVAHRCGNDFSVGGAKLGENIQDNQIQNITLSNK